MGTVTPRFFGDSCHASLGHAADLGDDFSYLVREARSHSALGFLIQFENASVEEWARVDLKITIRDR